MAETQNDFSTKGLVKATILPAILVFLIPVISLFFFRHAQNRFDAQFKASMLQQIESDSSQTSEQKAKARTFFGQHPLSELMTHQEVAGQFNSTIRFYFATFRWMILLSVLSIASGILVFLLTGVCVLLSRRSQRAQYLSLSIGWQVLRVFGAFQTICQGIMVLALSFWGTVLWFEVYFVKLILVAGILALVAIFSVIKAIFHRPPSALEVEGQVLDRSASPRLWKDLEAICAKVGTKPPDQIILGIDDSFYVTESPVKVNEVKYQGRTLYVSLSLLKQMRGEEADAVLAHEMAHFSGDDTLYSKKISPLLSRFNAYLGALHENPVAIPVYYFMRCFRVLFELSLGEHSRKREFRADRIAADTTSPAALASSLLRIVAYSDYRGKIQRELFEQERALEATNISGQLEQGFQQHALSFIAKPDLETLETAHPFDSHPPMVRRLDAVGVPLRSEEIETFVSTPGDGRWYHAIDGAEEAEKQQWNQFEERFRAIHEQTLPYRFLPTTDEERAIVVKSFPEVTFDGKKGTLTLDCESISYSVWNEKITYSEISSMSLDDHVLSVVLKGDRPRVLKIPTKKFATEEQEIIQAVNAYYSRYMNAVAYQVGRVATQGTEVPQAD